MRTDDIMFYKGNLQSGISLALQEQKCVACFVRDDAEESNRWENDYFSDEQVVTALSAKAITLRIEAHSQEATLLKDYYSIPLVPALILVQYVVHPALGF